MIVGGVYSAYYMQCTHSGMIVVGAAHSRGMHSMQLDVRIAG